MKKDPTRLMHILVDDPQWLLKNADETIIPNAFKFYSLYSPKNILDIKTSC